MRHLSQPATDAEDDEVLRRLCTKPEWEAHQTAWLAAYANYRRHAGNPFLLQALSFGPGVSQRQSNLYDSRKSSGPLTRIRRNGSLRSCPVCGSPVIGHLDHYLPRKCYPEFSIMRLNLVPACSHCNSDAKGDTVAGVAPERFIHPYFDDWASDDLWTIDILRPLEAATFQPRPVDTLDRERAAIVTFHLNNVLGRQFHLSMANEWSTYPQLVAIRNPNQKTVDVVAEVGRELSVAISSKGNNSWSAALFRGLSDDLEALEFVQARAIAILQADAARKK